MNLDPLITLLHHEQALHDKMLRAKKRERQLLAGVHPTELLHNAEDLLDLTEQVERLENKRRELTRQLAAEMGMEEDEPALNALIAVLPGERQSELRQAGEALRRTLVELRETNQYNAQLLEQSVETLNWEIHQMFPPDESGVYTQNGEKGSSPVPRAGLNLRA